MVVERSKNILIICPNLKHFLVSRTFLEVFNLFSKRIQKIISLQEWDNFTPIELNVPSCKSNGPTKQRLDF